ncbi:MULTISPECIES: aliphatic sulfonate ABC transporter permease SsuC [Pseudomonas syringae group]|uniref:Aliphatic sulfonate ABC transporter permease SsuC n=1 Tax=Pseudomonas lijiangensis TaxID=2995658 RepID=A0ABX8HQS7_9PSED|nr:MULTISPECIES: aliphatic sulfonate ABC transporter permease SsuC [Pseudomonas syringae group]MBX8487346.1 aliphatic sulfonate ABC transporter permease SsuC [Pseudomonas cichorii]MBX8495312.1 aliphatic sulfonate ABC transporter permease SsuC [Pseudomonas cichorii]MBX8501796.1 aliphatic sulfonate ABC transporter permease SsuC [Pseudomonas lijiangensis]MBX8506631.1 aliphatic sulfonate ABC transporter permease SsuC [Pseudomonas lijiangensis]MBX8517276.1 aliphatic sulfonate ABC transporter permea
MSLSASQRTLHRLAPWALPVLLLAVWQLSVSAGWLSTRILPAPSAVIEAGVNLIASGEIWTHLAISGWRAGIGFAIGGGIGLVLGFITGLTKWGERLLDSSVQMIRNVPHLALIPLVILWFGIDETAKIFLVALGTLFPIYLNTYHGIRNIDPALVEMSRSYGLSGFSLFRHVILPGAMPSILVGVRFALGFMWLTLIVAETISASSGIGYLAMNAREFLQTDVVVLAIVLYAVLGKLADLAARALERVCLRWHPAYQVSKGGAA